MRKGDGRRGEEGKDIQRVLVLQVYGRPRTQR
jgi:hypothetical protein